MDLWRDLKIELDSLRLALQQNDVQKMLSGDIEHTKNYETAYRQMNAVATFARRAAEFIKQLEQRGEIAQQHSPNEPFTKESVDGNHVLGQQARVVFPAFGGAETAGKVDTGATTSSLHATNVKSNGGNVSFQSEILSNNIITMPLEGTQEVHSADFGGDQRPVVKMDIEIEGVPIKGVMFNLNDRSKMDSKLLIGQDILKAGDFHVNVGQEGSDEEPVREDKKVTNEANLFEAIKTLADSNITIGEFVKYLRTEAINRLEN